MRCILALVIMPALAIAAAPIDETLDGLKKACDHGGNWLVDHQNADGGYGPQQMGASTVGVTSLVTYAIVRSPRGYKEVDGPFVSDAIGFLLKNQKEDGGIYDYGVANYSTSLSVLALAALDRKKYEEVIAGAREFLIGCQLNEETEPRPYLMDKHTSFGGNGYGSSRRADMNNTGHAMEALHEARLPKDHPYWKRGLTFLRRSQNFCETNDAITGGMLRDVDSTEDGGFTYYPGYSPAGSIRTQSGKTAHTSYGTMTYVGIKSFIYAGLSRDDRGVRAAYDWIRMNYTLDVNPGMGSSDPKHAKDGLYYNYVVMAKALALIGEPIIVTADGKRHLWAQELAEKLISLQKPDGTWVNENPRWWESIPEISTSYALLALSTCRDVLKGLEESEEKTAAPAESASEGGGAQ